EEDPLRRETVLEERLDGEAHHDLRPADERGRPLRTEPRSGDELRDDADVAQPVAARRVDRDLDVGVPPPAEARVGVEEGARRPRAAGRAGRRARAAARPGARPAPPPPPAPPPRPPPAAPSTGHALPNGPRRPSTRPGSEPQIAALTAPTERTVSTTGPGRPGDPLTEIGTSPIPKAYAITNWPGCTARPSPSTGSSARVHVSAASSARSAA